MESNHERQGVLNGRLESDVVVQDRRWIDRLSLAAPESLAGPPLLRRLGLDGWLVKRMWPKLGTLPFASLLESTQSRNAKAQGEEPAVTSPHIVVDQPMPEVTRQHLAVALLIDWIQAFIIILALILAITGLAYWYHKRSTKSRSDFTSFRAATTGAAGPPIGVEESFREWQHGVCGCMSEPGVCVWGFLCPSIRWADTIGVVGYLGFWSAFSIYVLLQAVGFVTGELLLWIALALLCTGYRQQLRESFGMKRDRVTFVQDCLLYCCCPCCLIVQEAKHVDEALKVGHPIFLRTAASAAEEVPTAPPPSDPEEAVSHEGAATST